MNLDYLYDVIIDVKPRKREFVLLGIADSRAYTMPIKKVLEGRSSPPQFTDYARKKYYKYKDKYRLDEGHCLTKCNVILFDDHGSTLFME